MKIPGGGKRRRSPVVLYDLFGGGLEAPGGHAYLDKPEFQAGIEAAEAMNPGLTHVAIFHDEWCRRLKGGVCNCDPDVGSFQRLR